MNIEKAYDLWSNQYDSNDNKTRDLEATALRSLVADIPASNILEIGCGTGKNSQFLVTKAQQLVAVDLSSEMLSRAKEKVNSPSATFLIADINQSWDFTDATFDLIIFSLVLEHIRDLEFIFNQAAQKLNPGGKIYIGELHPFKQYSGSKARFEVSDETTVVECYTHNVSDFIMAAKEARLKIEDLQEFFDDNDRNGIPRILAMIFCST